MRSLFCLVLALFVAVSASKSGAHIDATREADAIVDKWLSTLPSTKQERLRGSENLQQARDQLIQQQLKTRLQSVPTWQPSVIPDPGQPGQYTSLTQFNITLSDPTRQAVQNDNREQHGFTLGISTNDVNGHYQFVYDCQAPGNDALVGNYPDAIWYWSSVTGQPVPAQAFRNRGFAIGKDGLPLSPGKSPQSSGYLLPIMIFSSGWCSAGGAYWPEVTHYASKGFLACVDRGVTDECFDFNFTRSVYNQAKNLQMLLDRLEVLNQPNSGHILSGRLDLSAKFFLGHSDGGSALIQLATGDPVYGGIQDDRVKTMWLPRDPAAWEHSSAILNQLNL